MEDFQPKCKGITGHSAVAGPCQSWSARDTAGDTIFSSLSLAPCFSRVIEMVMGGKTASAVCSASQETAEAVEVSQLLRTPG
jgi:hypothetical protein